MNHFADRLRHARKLRGLSQSALADACGLSQGAIANYESKSRRSTKAIFRLAAALEVEPLWLAQGTGDMEISGTTNSPQSTFLVAESGPANNRSLWPFPKIAPASYWSLSPGQRGIIEETVASLIRSLQEK